MRKFITGVRDRLARVRAAISRFVQNVVYATSDIDLLTFYYDMRSVTLASVGWRGVGLLLRDGVPLIAVQWGGGLEIVLGRYLVKLEANRLKRSKRVRTYRLSLTVCRHPYYI